MLAGIVSPLAELTNISLARGAPSLDIVAVDDLKRVRAARRSSTIRRARSRTGPRWATRGCVEWIANKHGVHPDQVVATNGSMQADAFLFERLVEPGDVVVVEAPTYDRTLLVAA